ncbi:TPA: hypothetical protein ACJJXC_004556 [Enterobacter cloacae]|uniref:hypothetical protein n=1 Tax=Enterobacter cloacae TaxID=550 RepID=UPI00292D5F51|nr:hypothetical protein [Enterobacter cloacae]
MSSIDIRALLGVPKHANQHRLSRLTMEVHTDELRIMASEVESYTDELIAALEAAAKRIAELSASHGKLREAMAGIHNTITGRGAYTPLAAILNASKRAYEESAAAAGKGE